MNPRPFRFMSVVLTLALAVPTMAHADSQEPAAAPAAASGEGPVEVAARPRRPAARPVRVPAARRAYRPATTRRASYRPYRPYRGYRARPVYVAPYRPGYGYARPMGGGVAASGLGGMSWLSLGGQLAAISDANDDGATSGFGGGAGFELGYGFRPAHALGFETAFGMTFHDINESQADLGVLGHLTFDARIYLGREDRALHPYLLVGLGAYFTGRSDTSDPGLSGVGFQAGGGFGYFLSEDVSLGVKGTYRGAFLDNSGSTFSGQATDSAWLSTFNLAGDLKFYF